MLPTTKTKREQLVPVSAQRVRFFNIGSGRVGYWTKYRVPGWEGVSKYPGIFLTHGCFGYFGYFHVSRVFTGIYGYYRYLWEYMISSLFLVDVSKLLKFDGSSGDLEGIHANM